MLVVLLFMVVGRFKTLAGYPPANVLKFIHSNVEKASEEYLTSAI